MIDIKPLIPESLSQYRDAIAESLEYFLRRISSPSELLIDETQSFGHSDFGAMICLAMNHPTLHKLAQVLARHRSLPPDLRAALQALESFAPRMEFDEIKRTIHDELGDEFRQIEMAETALAEASVAVVVPFVLKPVANGTISRGVLKVLKPKVCERLESELAVWLEVGEFFADRCRHYRLPPIDHRETLEIVADLLRHEIDFTAEQRNFIAAAEALSHTPHVRVPQLFPFCTSKVTAMERIDGVKVTNVGTSDVALRRRLAQWITQSLIVQPMTSPRESAMFHGDPHAGNLMATNEGELAILDWAMAGTLSEGEREQLAQLLLSTQLLDALGACRAIERLCPLPLHDASGLRTVIDRMFSAIRDPFGPPISRAARLMDAAALQCGVRFSKDLLLFRKTLLILEGVVADMIGEGGLDRLLSTFGILQLIGEWPARMFMPFDSRRLGSRLSSADLIRAGMCMPYIAATRWVHLYDSIS